MRTASIPSIGASAVLTLAAAHASCGPVESYDFTFATIGDPGNRATLDSEVYKFHPNEHLGAVDDTYRMSTTEVTVGQYFEFVEAYLPYYERRTGSTIGFSDFTGGLIRTFEGQASIRDGISANRAAEMSWEYAARYVNWLHNGKQTHEAAFETGAYDTSTFTQNPDGSWNHQIIHNPDADFWIPTRDEIVKAGHWDPNKNNGEGGYWLFPGSSDQELIPGLERNAGTTDEFPLDVGSFPDVQSPWGLLDLAGGVSEWTSRASREDMPHVRTLHGSSSGNAIYGDFFPADVIGYGFEANVFASVGGLRLAASVPSPGASSFLVGIYLILTDRRRSNE